MEFQRVPGVLVLSAILLLTSLPALARTPEFLDPTPVGENEISVMMRWTPSEFTGARTAPRNRDKIPARGILSMHEFAESGKVEYLSQIRIRRLGDAFAFRILLAGDGWKELRDNALTHNNSFFRFDADPDLLFEVNLVFDPELNPADRYPDKYPIGFVAISDFEEIETAFGTTLATDWIWSPYHLHEVRRDERSKNADVRSRNEKLWARVEETWSTYIGEHRRTNGAPYLFANEFDESYAGRNNYSPFVMQQVGDRDADAGRAREKHAEQLFSAQALAAISSPKALEATYLAQYADELEQMARSDAGEPRRQAVLAWMKKNADPVSPDAQIIARCGEVPPHWQETSSGEGYQESMATLTGRVQRLDDYADCIFTVWESFDHAAYEALYPEILEQVAIWEDAEGQLITSRWVPGAGHIRNHAHVAPEDVDRAFQLRIRQVTMPNAEARMDVAAKRERDATEQMIAEEEQRSTMEYQARMARAARIMARAPRATAPSAIPSSDDINNFDLLGMQENARIAAETGDVSVLFDSSGNVRTQQAPEVVIHDAQKRAAANRDPRQNSGSAASGAGWSGAGPDGTDDRGAPPVERNRFMFLATTKTRNMIAAGPNHGCSIPWDWASGPPAEGWGTITCVEVDTIDLYSVRVDGDACPFDGSARIMGPTAVARVFRIDNLTLAEVERGYQYTDEELHIFRRAQQDAKGNLEIRLTDRGPIKSPLFGDLTRHFRYLTEAQRFVREELGCKSYITPENGRPTPL